MSSVVPDPATTDWVPMGYGGLVQAVVPACRAYNSASVPCANATFVYVPLDSERFDTDNIHDPAVNNSRLTCRTAGKYLIVGHLRFSSAPANTSYIASINWNGTKEIARQSISGLTVNAYPEWSVSAIYDLAVNDYVQLGAWQNSGSTINVDRQDGWSPEFEMTYLGPGFFTSGGVPTPVVAGIPGEVKLWPGSALPDAKYGKWVWADGTVYVTSTYPQAAAAIATAWRTANGAADPGAGNFRVPDLRGLVPMALDQMPGGTRANRVTRAAAIAMAGRSGEEYHALTIAEHAAHAHGGATGYVSSDHSHSGTTSGFSTNHLHGPAASSYYAMTAGAAMTTAGASSGGVAANAGTTGWADRDHSHTITTGGISANHTHAITTEGGGGAHENLPPTIFVPYIVRLDG